MFFFNILPMLEVILCYKNVGGIGYMCGFGTTWVPLGTLTFQWFAECYLPVWRADFVYFFIKKSCLSVLKRTLWPDAAIRCRMTHKEILFNNVCTRVKERRGGEASPGIKEVETSKGNWKNRMKLQSGFQITRILIWIVSSFFPIPSSRWGW